jgi:hypothetical protein
MSSQHKLTHAWPLSSYYSAYVDLKKSVPHLVKGKLENPKGLAYWIPLQRYLVDLNDYLEVIKELQLDKHDVFDPETKKLVVRFCTVKGKSGIFDGKEGNGIVDLQYSQQLLAYRKRKDGLMGIESPSIDTRLSVKEKEKHPDKYPLRVKGTDSKEANFSSFISKEVK